MSLESAASRKLKSSRRSDRQKRREKGEENVKIDKQKRSKQKSSQSRRQGPRHPDPKIADKRRRPSVFSQAPSEKSIVTIQLEVSDEEEENDLEEDEAEEGEDNFKTKIYFGLLLFIFCVACGVFFYLQANRPLEEENKNQWNERPTTSTGFLSTLIEMTTTTTSTSTSTTTTTRTTTTTTRTTTTTSTTTVTTPVNSSPNQITASKPAVLTTTTTTTTQIVTTSTMTNDNGPTLPPNCIFPWKYNWMFEEFDGCANPDNDPNGDWCSTKLTDGFHTQGNYEYCNL